MRAQTTQAMGRVMGGPSAEATGPAGATVATIGARIRERREARRLTQQDLASALQFTAQAVSKWERGENAPDLAAVLGLARLLGVTTDWLLGATAAASEALEGTVLFADVAGSSHRRAHLGLPESLAWINGRQYQITEAVLAYDGIPVKYMDDAFLCCFAGPGHRERAVRAALHLRAMVSDPVRVGLASGAVYLGVAGHPDYAQRDLLGVPTRHAARAMEWAKGHTTSLVAAAASVLDAQVAGAPAAPAVVDWAGPGGFVTAGAAATLDLADGTTLQVHELVAAAAAGGDRGQRAVRPTGAADPEPSAQCTVHSAK